MLDEKISKIRDDLLPALQKETGEAFVIADKVLEKMDASSEIMSKLKSLLEYLFGIGNPLILEFISPANWRGLGQTPILRIESHHRIDEAFLRHPDFFSELMAQDFETSRVTGAELEVDWNNLLKEEKEAREVMEDCINTLADYRKLRRKIRNSLKGELADPQDAYKYIPKRKMKKRSS